MRTIMKNGIHVFLCYCLLFSLLGCSKDDPDYSNVEPPVVTLTYSINGELKTVGGIPIQGATVTVKIGAEIFNTTTNAKGEYSFQGLKNGTYTLLAEASGKLTKNSEIILGDNLQTNVYILNLIMPNAGTSAEIIPEQEKVIVTETETFTNNDASKVTITSTVPAGTTSQNATLIFTPIYTVEDALNTRANSTEVMATGILISSTNVNLQLQKTIAMKLSLPSEVAENAIVKKYKDGQWITIASHKKGNIVSFEADALASYALFVLLSESSTVNTIPVTFSQLSFDNLYGSKELQVGTITYTYISGSEITTPVSNPNISFLMELLAKRIKGTSVSSVTAKYPINITLPIGTVMSINGTQQVKIVSYSINGSSVSGKEYGSVNINITTANRHHTGGSN